MEIRPNGAERLWPFVGPIVLTITLFALIVRLRGTFTGLPSGARVAFPVVAAVMAVLVGVTFYLGVRTLRRRTVIDDDGIIWSLPPVTGGAVDWHRIAAVHVYYGRLIVPIELVLRDGTRMGVRGPAAEPGQRDEFEGLLKRHLSPHGGRLVIHRRGRSATTLAE